MFKRSVCALENHAVGAAVNLTVQLLYTEAGLTQYGSCPMAVHRLRVYETLHSPEMTWKPKAQAGSRRAAKTRIHLFDRVQHCVQQALSLLLHIVDDYRINRSYPDTTVPLQ